MTLRVGDKVTVLPSKKTSRINRIVTKDGDLPEASTPRSVTVTLEDEIDVTRGDMIVRETNQPYVRREADAMLIWMSEQPLTRGKQYWVKHTSHRTSGEVNAVRYAVDVNTLHRSPATTLRLNEVGRCRVAFHEPMLFDAYRRNRHTGAFILVDRITHESVAAGMFLDPESDRDSDEHWETLPAGQLQQAVSLVSEPKRAEAYGHQPFTILLTGLSGAGKSTLALELEKRLFDDGRHCILLDGQNMRFGISRDLGFSAEERSENLRRAAEICKLLNDSGLICIAAFVAPHADVRSRASELIGPERVIHIHLSTPVETCRRRDKTGRYLAADRGEIEEFPGVTSRYEEPSDVDLQINMAETSVEYAVQSVIDLLNSQSRLGIN